MKKILLALIIALSCGSAIANSETSGNVLLNATQSTNLLTINNPVSKGVYACETVCINEFRSCYSDPWGPGWTICEIFFERCMTDCGF